MQERTLCPSQRWTVCSSVTSPLAPPSATLWGSKCCSFETFLPFPSFIKISLTAICHQHSHQHFPFKFPKETWSQALTYPPTSGLTVCCCYHFISDISYETRWTHQPIGPSSIHTTQYLSLPVPWAKGYTEWWSQKTQSGERPKQVLELELGPLGQDFRFPVPQALERRRDIACRSAHYLGPCLWAGLWWRREEWRPSKV